LGILLVVCDEVLSHIFNHQTHHRGQASSLLSQAGVDIGITDYLMGIKLSYHPHNWQLRIIFLLYGWVIYIFTL